MVEEIETIDEEDNIEPQIWKDFEDTTERFRKSLYYGRIPSSDRFSLPVTELCVANFNHLGLEDLRKNLTDLALTEQLKLLVKLAHPQRLWFWHSCTWTDCAQAIQSTWVTFLQRISFWSP